MCEGRVGLLLGTFDDLFCLSIVGRPVAVDWTLPKSKYMNIRQQAGEGDEHLINSLLTLFAALLTQTPQRLDGSIIEHT